MKITLEQFRKMAEKEGAWGGQFERSWSLGGTYGNCWDSELGEAGPSEEEQFRGVDELLIKIAPNMSFLQYKVCMNDVVENRDYSSGDYYGGTINYRKEVIDVEKFYNKLLSMGIIEQ